MQTLIKKLIKQTSKPNFKRKELVEAEFLVRKALWMAQCLKITKFVSTRKTYSQFGRSTGSSQLATKTIT